MIILMLETTQCNYHDCLEFETCQCCFLGPIFECVLLNYKSNSLLVFKHSNQDSSLKIQQGQTLFCIWFVCLCGSVKQIGSDRAWNNEKHKTKNSNLLDNVQESFAHV